MQNNGNAAIVTDVWSRRVTDNLMTKIALF